MLERRVIGSEMEYGIMMAYTGPGLYTPPDWKPNFSTPSHDQVRTVIYNCMPSKVDLHDTQLDPRIYGIGSMLANGARLYVDNGHPEYATPEVTSPLDIVTNEGAGDRLVVNFMEQAKRHGHLYEYHLSRALADTHGNTWGCHRNVEVERATFNPNREFSGPGGAHHRKFQIAGAHQIAAPIYTGEGGLWRTKAGLQFVLSPKIMGVTCDFHTDTVKTKPLINQRDVALANESTRARWHITSGGSNINPLSKRLLHGTDMLMADAMEAGLEPDRDITFADNMMHVMGKVINTDPSCKATVKLADGSTISAVDIEHEILAMFQKLSEYKDFTEDDRFTLTHMERLLGQVAVDPMHTVRSAEWPLKLHKMKAHRKEDRWHHFGGTRALMHKDAWRIEHAWARIAATTTYADALRERLWSDWMPSPAAIERAMVHAPLDTRAVLREQFIRTHQGVRAGATWEVLRVMRNGESEDTYTYSRAFILDTLQTSNPDVDKLIRDVQQPTR